MTTQALSLDIVFRAPWCYNTKRTSIKYNPKDDKENNYFKKNKWEIPEIMKKEII
jgi:hypothetical protein